MFFFKQPRIRTTAGRMRRTGTNQDNCRTEQKDWDESGQLRDGAGGLGRIRKTVGRIRWTGTNQENCRTDQMDWDESGQL